jgi:hypothetical protein
MLIRRWGGVPQHRRHTCACCRICGNRERSRQLRDSAKRTSQKVPRSFDHCLQLKPEHCDVRQTVKTSRRRLTMSRPAQVAMPGGAA